MERYNPKELEKRWKKKWLAEKIYEPDFSRAKKPFYNLMMFPYPSAEGLHIGSVRTFTGVDIYGRFKRMQGADVFEPIGLDGFGIHSENYALKIGKHPAQLAKVTEKNFYRQLSEMGNGFAWNERLETYDPEYYRWTQWIFVELYKHGLAYRKKAAVNWCPSCKTVLADEQVVGDVCERCGTLVEKRELEQWFFKITDYAERLLANMEKIDWDEKVKVAQRNWIGRSEGAEIDFEIQTSEKPNFVLIHGYKGSPDGIFFPWLINELESRGYKVVAPQLPNTENPTVLEQVEYVLKNVSFDENTILLGHSLGAPVAIKVVERLKNPIRRLVLVAGFVTPKFKDNPRPFEHTFDWKFDFNAARKNSKSIVLLRAANDSVVPAERISEVQKNLGGTIIDFTAEDDHVTGKKEPQVLRSLIDIFTIFTTRPDTLFGATFIVLGPEHGLIESVKFNVKNWDEVETYIKKAKSKTEEERIREGKEKTGVELKGIKAINPANNKEIPVFVADYVLGNVGTGAIMAVPAHDERDFAFAKKFRLPIKIVICPHWPEKTCPTLDEAYTGEGHLVDSGKFDGLQSQDARRAITEFVKGAWRVQYRLRDWLISRQRYWGPPIPMIFCNTCGWSPVPERDLPVRLPFVKNFRPTGSGKSPLASVKSFYETKCPKCKKKARRETDVSDTFLDSAWYYIGYLAKGHSKFEIRNSKFRQRAKRWLPVDMYIGGLEHSVLHLLYSRFIAMALHNMGHIDFEEPFTKFVGHGLITKDGAKMSKSKGNIVNPDDYIRAYGADAVRMYLAFLSPLTEGGDFRDSGIKGITRFLERIYTFVHSNVHILRLRQECSGHTMSKENQDEIVRSVHRTVKKVTEDIERLHYNTAISALMTLFNKFEEKPEGVTREYMSIFLKLLAPFAPFLSEELWSRLHRGKKGTFTSIHREPWPSYDEARLKEETFELIVQVNGRVRGKVLLPMGVSEKDATEAALGLVSVKRFVAGKPKRVVFVPDKLLNFVI